ncbi:oligosaccharide flippase family protein [Gordonia alkanivorans]|uniref:lipopolysaccharide biosynthesis protein n=1 Tax=Gordonia alkanivorans TaxID=84096 RepID=UPI002448481F|nr:oligosaccharide flippase family protein [Gordonia alkanivorans]MDH3052485.1 oligosaccharide flippase family protein [Gordonia alkanivorans]
MSLAALVYTVVALFQKSLALILLPFVTHVMEPDVYGLVSLVTVVGTLISILLCSPVENAVFRWSARDAPESGAIVSLCAIYSLFLLPLLGIVVFISLLFREGELMGVDYSYWGIVCLAACLMASGTYFGFPYLRAHDRLARFALCSGISICVNFTLKICLVFLAEMGLQGWILSELGAWATLYFLVLVLARPRLARLGKGAVATLIRYGLPLLPHRLAFWGLTSMTRPIMAATATLHQLGIFSLAANCMAVGALLAGEINRAVLVEYGRERTIAPTAATFKVARIQLVSALAIPALVGCGVAIMGPVIFAPEYHGAYAPMAVLLFAQCAFAVYLIPMNYLCQTLGDTRFSWLSSCSGALIVLALLLAMQNSTTALTAAAVTSVGYLVMAFVAFETCRRSEMRVRWRSLVPARRVSVLSFVSFASAVVALSVPDPPVRVAFSVVGVLMLGLLAFLIYLTPSVLFGLPSPAARVKGEIRS